MPLVRTGGVHQGLSGARTVDVTSLKQEFTFDFEAMESLDYQWLEVMHSRITRRRLYLLNPLKPSNRVSYAASSMKSQGATALASKYGFNVGSNWRYSNEYPLYLLGFEGRSAEILPFEADFSQIIFDEGSPFPFLPDETLSFRVLMKASAGTLARFRLDWYDADHEWIQADGSSQFEIDEDWSQWSLSGVIPIEGAAGVTMGVQLDQGDNTVWVAAPQAHEGNSLRLWEPGGGAPEVVIESLDITSPRFPLRDGTLKLLEA